jgi:hypothetical protein
MNCEDSLSGVRQFHFEPANLHSNQRVKELQGLSQSDEGVLIFCVKDARIVSEPFILQCRYLVIKVCHRHRGIDELPHLLLFGSFD